MARRSDHTREELRSLFLTAAAGLVAEKGAAALNVRAIAAGAGYSPGSLYNVFRNLDDLVMHLNAATMTRLHAALAPKAGDEPAAALQRLARRYADFALANKPTWRLLFDYSFQEGEPLPDWYMAHIGMLLALAEAPVAALTGPEPPARRRARAFALWSAVHGVCNLLVGRDYQTFRDFDARQVMTLLVETLIDGLAARRGKKAGPKPAGGKSGA